MARRLLALLLAFFLGVQIVRIAWVDRLAEDAPAIAARLWPGHPEVEISRGMLEIATAARERRPVAPATLNRILETSREVPLAADPFLVRGVQAQLAGDADAAERAFLAAKRRNPRSLPARYFLADHYLREGDARNGLREVAALSRLTPHGAGHLAPYVANFARDGSNGPHVRALFRVEPGLEDATLMALAKDARNADLVLALASERPGRAVPPWLPDLLGALIKAEQFAKARAVWAKAANVPLNAGTLLHDGDFRRSHAPPPFNWSLTSSAVGLAERQKGGGLHVIFYGQQDGVLASQLLVLSPGRYRVTMRAPTNMSGADALHWTLVCATSNASIATASMESLAAGPWTFSVPAGCPAQRLELVGRSSDVPRQQVDVTIPEIRLQRERASE